MLPAVFFVGDIEGRFAVDATRFGRVFLASCGGMIVP